MNVVITGASKGLGKSIAIKFASAGHNLVLISRNNQTLSTTANELQAAHPGIKVNYKPFDLSTKAQAQAAGQWILSLEEPIDVLVNNAGQFIPGSVFNEPDGAIEEMIQHNFMSAYHLTRTLLPSMINRKSGHIFNMCSIASFQAYPNGGSYSISKFALAGFSKNLREEMKPFGIKVTSIFPGAAYTDSWASSGIDRNRFMEAEDVSDMIFAASQLSLRACVEEIILRPQTGDI
jgi:short-subunit dehydrogenase